MFYKYFHLLGIQVKSKEIEMMKMGDNIYSFSIQTDNLFTVAKEFNILNEDNLENRKKYFIVID